MVFELGMPRTSHSSFGLERWSGFRSTIDLSNGQNVGSFVQGPTAGSTSALRMARKAPASSTATLRAFAFRRVLGRRRNGVRAKASSLLKLPRDLSNEPHRPASAASANARASAGSTTLCVSGPTWFALSNSAVFSGLPPMVRSFARNRPESSKPTTDRALTSTTGHGAEARSGADRASLCAIVPVPSASIPPSPLIFWTQIQSAWLRTELARHADEDAEEREHADASSSSD